MFLCILSKRKREKCRRSALLWFIITFKDLIKKTFFYLNNYNLLANKLNILDDDDDVNVYAFVYSSITEIHFLFV